MVVVNPHDTVIISVSEKTVHLQTSGGLVPAKCAMIRTPCGIVEGLMSEGSPRLLPMSLLEFDGWFHSEKGVSSTEFRGKKVICEKLNGLPALHDSVFESRVLSGEQSSAE